MSVKSELRKKLISDRKSICDKSHKDDLINEKLLHSNLLLKYNTILLFAPTAEEINIKRIIDFAFSNSKRVAFPKCSDKNGNMAFYYVDSYDKLQAGMFGICEPIANKESLVTDFDDALCIVPALSADRNGYRIGYGKGYYDRFLQKNNVISIVLCYNELLSNAIPTDKYDQKCNYVVTDCEMFKTPE